MSCCKMCPFFQVTFEYFGARHAMMDLAPRREVTAKHGAEGFRCGCERCTREDEGMTGGTGGWWDGGMVDGKQIDFTLW